MNTTWFENGVDKGQREALHVQLEERFGPLAPVVVERLQQMPAERLATLARAVVRTDSLRELGLED